MMKSAVKLKGNKVILVPLGPKDAPLLHKWINDLEVAKTTTLAAKILSLEDECAWLKRARLQKNRKILGIADKKSGKLIGTIGLHNINETHKRASLGIIIGDKFYWGKKYGREAITVFLDFAFNVLNLHSIWLNVYSYNVRAIRAYKAIGFREAGRLREAHFWGGKYYDIIKMDILDSEFKQSKIKNLILEAKQLEARSKN